MTSVMDALDRWLDRAVLDDPERYVQRADDIDHWRAVRLAFATQLPGKGG